MRNSGGIGTTNALSLLEINGATPTLRIVDITASKGHYLQHIAIYITEHISVTYAWDLGMYFSSWSCRL
jgi:hypothetical protein